MMATIQETIATLHDTLQGYIEATYHIADPKIVAQRRALLRSAGGIFQTPYVESTPRYVTGKSYAQMTDIPAAAREAFGRLAAPATGKPLLFDPPYTHQADAIRTILGDQRNVMIMTGTGSGKTESFLLPILGKLAIEARGQSAQFAAHSAVRAMVLYPMNALVNDQLGRLRTLFGDPRLVEMFQGWSGRAATFARYTSRTPYAGVRTKEKDSARLRSIGDFFVDIEDAAKRHADGTPIVDVEDARAAALMGRLQGKGKWPAKPSVSQWFGSGRWMAGSAFRRAVTLDDDAELMTRYEIQQAPPDLLITNYSMLEYMMLRPIERSIFEATRAWLQACPDEKFLIVLDEAHLYRGAQGAEVGLLLRRLRERLAIPPNRFQVICATASFSDAGKAMAGAFGAQLTGVDAASFVPVTGDLKLREGAAKGDGADLASLASIDLDLFFSEDAAGRTASIAPFLATRGVTPSGNDEADLFHALSNYSPFALLVNETMRRACALDELPDLVFDDPAPDAGARAINALLATGSRARLKPDDASLLPCRVHAFYRGLPGLWACMDPDCTSLAPAERGGPIGKLYAQPRDRCGCGAPVLAYFTCRYCGTSYARAYTKDVGQPDHLFAEPGQTLITSAGVALTFQPLDLMLEASGPLTQGIAANYDLASGLLNPDKLSARHRLVYLRPQASGLAAAAGTGTDDDDEDEGDDGDDGSAGAGPGQFVPCGCCGRSVRGGKASVQDHVTKGDQPFQALVSAQIRVQPPSPAKATEFAPLRGRKVLVFSDSRQVAARLAPALQVYSLKDTLRALLPVGYQMLGSDPVIAGSIVLDNAWLATVVAAHKLGVRLRPELEPSETMPSVPDTPIGAMPGTKVLIGLLNQEPPANLIRALVDVLRDNILGLEPLAVASIIEAESETAKIMALPPLVGLAETPEDKLGVARAWLRAWSRKSGIWFRGMPNSWWGTGGIVRSHKGDFRTMQHVLSTPALKKNFKKEWISRLMPLVTEQADGGSRLLARKLSLRIGGDDWRRCARCTSVHRAIATVPVCIDCGSIDVHAFVPDTDPVFLARKGFYRGPVIEALGHDEPDLMSIIAAEHTAQLNAARPDAAFSQAEHHEMQFQDIDLSWRDVDQGRSTSIDVLSSTTTMEVGIDIGDLSGVALRNMPPGRANYQQRAGRAGRRGNAVATVVAFGSADSHDDHYFTRPQEMIRGQVVDPRLTLENPDIARRHIRAFLLQRYHEYKLPTLNPSDPALANLFSVLGTVGDFTGTGPLNRLDLQAWLNANEAGLRAAIDGWLPGELSQTNRTMLLDAFIVDLLGALDLALGGQQDAALLPDEGAPAADTPPWMAPAPEGTPDPDQPEAETDPVPDDDQGLDAAADNLLDRLLYWGVLPRYAFPTDVAPFYVFSANSTGYRAEMEFAPSQGLNLALSQYAPNKQIWIKGKQYTSKAIYSPFPDDRRVAWGRKRLYYECERCGHAKTEGFYDPAKRGERLTCEACHTPNSFGPAKPWFRPPGFAHVWKAPAPSVPDEPNETAYATRAKLVMTADGMQMGAPITSNVRGLATRQHLLVSNSGPDSDGYDYCVRCGRIESSAAPEMNLSQPHALPYPNDNDPPCPGFSSRGVVLGTDFPTDIALFALRLEMPFRLIPAHSETLSAMRTVCEALAKAACRLLEIEPGEVLAEYRPALNEHGAAGSLVEVFLYDTLAGGAGFAPQLVPRGQELFETALSLLEDCPEQCDASCYRCLRSFRNKLDHGLLDRFVGAQLLRHLLFAVTARFDHGRAARSLAILAADLRRQLPVGFNVEQPSTSSGLSGPLKVQGPQGKTAIIDIHSPITPGVPVFGSTGAVLVDDLRIRRHLGEEAERVLSSLV